MSIVRMIRDYRPEIKVSILWEFSSQLVCLEIGAVEK